MTKLEEGASFELQQKRWSELIELRQAMTDHEIDTAAIELTISNLINPKKEEVTDSTILDGKELMAMIVQLEELQIDSSNVKMALAKAFVSGISGVYEADLLRMKAMVKMREQMAGMGISTGCVEATIAGLFQPLSLVAEAIKPAEVSEASLTKPCSPEPEFMEPAELDASASATFKRSAAEICEPAELEAIETAVTTKSPLSTETGKPVESRAQTPEMTSASKDMEIGKSTEMSSPRTVKKPPSSDAEHIAMVGTSIEAMELNPSPATTSSPLTDAPYIRTSPSVFRSAFSTKTVSSLSRPSTMSSKPSAKRCAPTGGEAALGSAQNPIRLGSSAAPKSRKIADKVAPRADLNNKESWRVPIESVGIQGLYLKPRYDEIDLSIAFDVDAQRLVFYKGRQSLTALYPDLEINPEALVSLTRPTYVQSKQLKVRFVWLNADAEETFLDIVVATKQDCRELVSKLRTLTSFSEILLPERRINRLCQDATWLVNETQTGVGLSVEKVSKSVWLD